MPLIDIGKGEPLVFVPILEHLEFVYARQIRAYSSTRRVIMYRRRETRTHPIGLAEREAWLGHMRDAVETSDATPLDAAALMAYFEAAAMSLLNDSKSETVE